jgi:integrase
MSGGIGNITRRGKHSWRIKLELPADPMTGKRAVGTHTVRGSRKKAEAERTRLLNGLQTGNYVDASKATVAEFLDRWDKDWATHNLSPKTLERDRELIRLCIVPHIGHMEVQRLRPIHLAGLYTTLLTAGRASGGGLAPRTVKHVHTLVHRILGHAQQWGLVSVNVAGAVDPPKVANSEIECLNADQLKFVMQVSRDAVQYPMVAVAVGTGMRRGEMLALRWRDVDLDAAVVRVERSLEETKAGLRFKEPKTRQGRRNIALPSSLVSDLRSHWRSQQEQRLALGMGRSGPDDLVFCTVDGKPKSPNNVTREWSRLAKAKKFPKVSFHALRHTHVSQLIASGMDVLTISRRIGHASPSITLNVYGHLFRNNDKQAAAVIDAAFCVP